MKIKLLTVVLLAALVSFPATPAGAGGICKTETATLIRVHASRNYLFRSIRLPPPPIHVDEEYVVTRGGAGFVIRTERKLCCDLKVTRTLAEGLARPPAIAALGAALTANHVEEQVSCVEENDVSGPIGARILGNYEVSWYGGGGWTREFVPGRVRRSRRVHLAALWIGGGAAHRGRPRLCGCGGGGADQPGLHAVGSRFRGMPRNAGAGRKSLRLHQALTFKECAFLSSNKYGAWRASGGTKDRRGRRSVHPAGASMRL